MVVVNVTQIYSSFYTTHWQWSMESQQDLENLKMLSYPKRRLGKLLFDLAHYVSLFSCFFLYIQ